MPATTSPFDLSDDDSYRRWRDARLAAHPTRVEELLVEVGDPRALTDAEHGALLDRIQRCNMAVYVSALGDDPDKDSIRQLGLRFGLSRLDDHMCADDDAISSLEATRGELRAGYIPYTNRPIAWHTDGYYNGPERDIRGLLLHCVRPAGEGGVNDLLDHEIAYILLRDQNPDHIRALMHPLAMTIPANVVDGKVLRPDVSGPVFSVKPDGCLHMRYTARTRSIRWREGRDTQAAVAALEEILKSDTPYHFRARLESGWGLVSNNVLHTRSRFEEDSGRLLYRGRYFDRIAGS